MLKPCAMRSRSRSARKESLEGILSHRAYTTESVKRLFTEIERGHAGGFRPLGVLADFVEVTQPEWERASEEFLHEELEYVVVHELGRKPNAAWKFLRAASDGRATFLVHDARTRRSVASTSHAPDFSHDPAVAGQTARRGAPDQRILALLRKGSCRAWPAASWCPIAPTPHAWLQRIPIAISCCPTARAITATPSPVGGKSSVAVRSP